MTAHEGAHTTRSLFDPTKQQQELFREDFDNQPFLFYHCLTRDDRFEMDHIRELARRLPGRITFNGQLPVENGFRQPDGRKLSFDQSLEQLETGQSWIILKKVHEDPEYAPLLQECLSEVQTLTGRRLEPLIESRTMSMILSSPGQVTPYHIDADCNFLFQCRGCKTFYVFNGRDRSVLPVEEEESFWAGNLNAAKYREENQAKAWSFALEPGNGVHVPVIFPHWVQNSENVSVSLSINFRFLGRLRGDVYRVNYLMRRIGLHPRDVGQSRTIDSFKMMMIGRPRAAMLKVRRLLRDGRQASGRKVA